MKEHAVARDALPSPASIPTREVDGNEFAASDRAHDPTVADANRDEAEPMLEGFPFDELFPDCAIAMLTGVVVEHGLR